MQSEQLTDNNLHKEVVKQLEYYFSDSNLRNDYFIKKLIQKTGGGWLSVETLMKFNRLKSLVNNKQTVLMKIINTMTSDLIETNPNGYQIRRRPDIPVPEMGNAKLRKFSEKKVKNKTNEKMDTIFELNGKPDKSIVKSEATVLQLKGLPRRLVLMEKKMKTKRIKDFFGKDEKVVYIGTDPSGNCLVQFNDQFVLKKVLESQLFKQITADTKQIVYKLKFMNLKVSAQVLTAGEELKFWMRANKRAENCLKIKEKGKQKKELKTKTNTMRKQSNSSVKYLTLNGQSLYNSTISFTIFYFI